MQTEITQRNSGTVEGEVVGYKKPPLHTRFKPGQSGNLAGPKPGYKHLSTWIQELLNDESFVAQIQEGYKVTEYKGAPIKAIVKAQMRLAMNGDTKAFDALAKYGYGAKLTLANDADNPITQTVPPEMLADFKQYLATKSKE